MFYQEYMKNSIQTIIVRSVIVPIFYIVNLHPVADGEGDPISGREIEIQPVHTKFFSLSFTKKKMSTPSPISTVNIILQSLQIYIKICSIMYRIFQKPKNASFGLSVCMAFCF